MSEICTHLQAPSHRRLSPLITPREHGAWGLLLVPLATGGAIGVLSGGSALPLVPLTVAALSLFWLRTPLESCFGTGLLRAQSAQERRVVGTTILILAAVGAAALASLFWHGRHRVLLLLGITALFAFVAQAFLRRSGRRMRMPAQIVGTLGLTTTAAAAYYLTTGRLDRVAWALWLANFLFAGNQVHFVQLCLHSARVSGWTEKLARGRSFLLGELLLISALWLACHFDLFPFLAALAFLPLVIRGVLWLFDRQTSLVVRRLGWTELAHAVAFGVLLSVAFTLRR